MQEEDPKEKVKDFMNSPVTSVDSNVTIQDAAQVMQTKMVSAILIKENNEFVGIVTERDFTHRAAGGGVDPKTTKISTIMSQPLNTIDQNQHVLQANEFMHDNNVRHISVTDDGQIVGLLSLRDVFVYYMRLFGVAE